MQRAGPSKVPLYCTQPAVLYELYVLKIEMTAFIETADPQYQKQRSPSVIGFLAVGPGIVESETQAVGGHGGGAVLVLLHRQLPHHAQACLGVLCQKA